MCAQWRENWCFILCIGCKKWRTSVWAKYWLLLCCRGSASPASDSCWGTAFSAECSPFCTPLSKLHSDFAEGLLSGQLFFFFSFSGVIFFLFNRGGVKQDYRSMAVLKRNCMVLPLVQFVQNPEQRTVCLWLWLPVNAGSPGLPFKKRKENKNKVGGGVAVGTSVEADAQAP